MSKIRAAIKGVGGYVPEYVMTNEEISSMVETSDEWIMSRIGIKERRILKKEEGSGVSYLGIKAVNDLINKTKIDPKEVEAVIFATTTPDYFLPNTGCLTAYHTGMTNAFCFDLSAACSGFLYALEVGSSLINCGKYKKVVVIAGDVLSTITNYEDRNTCPIFGDGCGAVLLETDDEGNGFIDSILRSDGNSLESLHMLGGGSAHPATMETVNKKEHFIYQDGKVVFKRAVSSMSDTCVELMKKNNLTNSDVDWVIAHQANHRIIDAVARRMELSPEKVIVNIEKYGNTSAATIPLCFWDFEKRFKKGDNIILTAFGAGFTWGATYIKWAYDTK